MTRTELVLSGCRPMPLASYLKALGVLRLVAEQVDRDVRGSWGGDGFVLACALDRAELIDFFAARFVPTPIVAPWNGASGFHEGDNIQAITFIEGSNDPRLSPYREAILAARRAVSMAGLTEKPDEHEKDGFLALVRGELPDPALAWFDAAVALVTDGADFPPLLGTGGNDGHLDFSNNQMQRLMGVLGSPLSAALLGASLFGDAVPALDKGKAIGQFSPAAAGGANAGAGFGRQPLVNPWDYILMLEGALLFGAAVTRRGEVGPGTLAFPFTVRASGVGYPSASLSDEAKARHEMWLPLWERPTGLVELRALLAEGRTKVGQRTARTGVDLARAVSTLGVDRGVSGFARFGFHLRNGKAYFATPLGLWTAERRRAADLLTSLDGWLERFRRVSAQGPAGLRRALRSVEAAVLDVCARGDSGAAVLDLLVALGGAEAVVSRSPKGREVPPIPPLPLDWLEYVDDHSVELRLAAALASTGLREHLAPVRLARSHSWLDQDDGRTVWGERGLVSNLCTLLFRREIDIARDWRPSPPTFLVGLDDIATFIGGQVDEDRLEEVARGLSLLRWNDRASAAAPGSGTGIPPAAFALLSVAHRRVVPGAGAIPATPGLLRYAAAGDAWRATSLAVRRLEASGVRLRLGPIHEPTDRTRRIAAALAFPLSQAASSHLFELVAQPTKGEEDS